MPSKFQKYDIYYKVNLPDDFQDRKITKKNREKLKDNIFIEHEFFVISSTKQVEGDKQQQTFCH